MKGTGEIEKVDVKIDENIKGEENANTKQTAQFNAVNTHTYAKGNVSDRADETVQDAK